MNVKQEFNNFFSTNLNPEQQEAVAQKNGVVLVIAGAGSGKTRIITSRIINLIVTQDCAPSAILALTFTNKAAHEMKERVDRFLLHTPERPFIGTFHSYCLSLLRSHAQHLQLPSFSILDQEDQHQMLQAIIKKNGLEKKISAKNLGYKLSSYKNNKALSIHMESEVQEPLLPELHAAYEHEKKISKCLDFDDLLLEVLALLRSNSDFRHFLQAKIRHVLVDEYQDTNVVQHELLKLLTLDQKNLSADSLCIVGDEDQSIYSWRGATIANILNFKKDFPSVHTIKVEQNYRSVEPILHAANSVIENNKQRNPKNLWSEKKATNRIKILTCLSGFQEGEVVASFLKTVAKKDGLASTAILYRAHYQSRSLEEALVRNSIPYKIISGIQFYERKEIKDLLAYLRLVVNPYDRVSLFRILNCPQRGLGEKFEELFQQTWDKEPFSSFLDITHQLKREYTKKRQEALAHFIATFSRLSPEDAPSKALSMIIDHTGYFTYLKNMYDPQEAESKVDNIKELLRATAYFEESGVNTILMFLNEVSLMQEHSKKEHDTQDYVKLMTLHSAKGLEFDTVILSCLEEGSFPSIRSFGEIESLEEERRLFYVGITRARERLLLSHARYRYTYGQMTDQLPSRFLDEIPNKVVTHDDASNLNTAQLLKFFGDWLGISQESSIVTFGAVRKEEPVKETPKKSTSLQNKDPWKKNQPVQHATFGIGYIDDIERKSNHDVYLTVNFKTGKKKIKSSFITTI